MPCVAPTSADICCRYYCHLLCPFVFLTRYIPLSHTHTLSLSLCFLPVPFFPSASLLCCCPSPPFCNYPTHMTTATTASPPSVASTSPVPSSSLAAKSKYKRNVRNDLMALRLWYLFYFGAQFTQLFLPLVLDSVMHLSSSTIGVLMSIRRFTIFLIAPLFAVLCDATLQHRLLLLLAHGLYYACTFVLTRARALWAIAFVIVIREACIAGCEPAVNTAAFAKLAAIYNNGQGEKIEKENNGKKSMEMTSRFGSLRLFGSLGWGFASLIVPVVCEQYFHSSLLPVLYAQIILGVPVLLLVGVGLDLSPGLFQQARTLKAVASASAPDRAAIDGDEETGGHRGDEQQQQRAWDVDGNVDNNNNAHPNYSSLSSHSTTMTNNSTNVTVTAPTRHSHQMSQLHAPVQKQKTPLPTVSTKSTDRTPLLHEQKQQDDHQQTLPRATPSSPTSTPSCSNTSTTTHLHSSASVSVASPPRSSSATRERLALVCVLAAFEQGVVIGATQTTLQIYYLTIGISVSVIGLSVLCGCLAEGTMFLMDGHLRQIQLDNLDKRFIQCGIFARTLAMFAYVAIGHIPAKWKAGRTVLVVATEVMCGGSFGLFVSSVLQTANRVAPARWQTGGQGVVTSVLFGVGPAVGALVSGWLYQQVGTQWLYGGMALWNVAVVFVIEMYM